MESENIHHSHREKYPMAHSHYAIRMWLHCHSSHAHEAIQWPPFIGVDAIVVNHCYKWRILSYMMANFRSGIT